MTKDVLDILGKLISYPSITPNNAGCLEYVSDFLKNLGFETFIQEFGEGDEKTTNLFAIHGYNPSTDLLNSGYAKKKHLCFVGHIDVVPPGNIDEWNYDPFRMTIKNDTVYGRGAVDMKGAVACMLASISHHIKNCTNSENSIISMILTSDEEGNAIFGIDMMLKWMYTNNLDEVPAVFVSNNSSRPINFPLIDFAIVGEPTCTNQIGDTIKIGRRGSVSFDLSLTGIQGHVAYPNNGAVNAAHVMSNVLHELCSFKFNDADENFDLSSLQITSINVPNVFSNVIPSYAEAKFNVRFNVNTTLDDLINIVDGCIKIHGAGLQAYTLTHYCNAYPFISVIDDDIMEFSRIVQRCCEVEPILSTSGGTSDARFVRKYAKNIVEFGLLNSTAHKINENTQKSHLQMLYNVYSCYMSYAQESSFINERRVDVC